MWSWQCSNYPFLCHQNNISNFNLINRNGNFVCWAEEDGREKSVKCEGQFFNSEMTVLHSAFPSHLPSPPFDAEWEAEFDKKLELFLDVALCRAAQANTRSLPRSRLLILTGIHQLPEISEFGKEREKGTKEGRETERVLAFSGGGEEEPKICAYKLQTAATKMQLLSVHSFVTTRAFCAMG